MNFFEQQDHARRQTRMLIVLFVLAVIGIVAAVNLAMAVAWSWTQSGMVFGIHDYPKGFFATNTLVTLALIAGGTLIEMFNLREGGEAVAKMAGGRMVALTTTDLQERRLLNVVEEMALASGIACPKVYVLDREPAINAFAAGYNPNEAVVAVTRGALTRLTRDELQGVIGHEFSHILNGDMRLNIRLIGLLFGIQMIAGFGQHLLNFSSNTWSVRDRSDRNGSTRVVLLATGLALLVIGYIGVLFGRLIKAAVSRQREFLADASAVQFTRNADGLGGALRKIGGLSRGRQPGSRIEHPNAEQLSHLFLGAPRRSLVSGLLATHPPLEERLRRIYGRAVGMLDAPELPGGTVSATTMLPDIPYVAAGLAGESTPTHWISGNEEAGQQVALPQQLDAALRDPQAACSLVYALLSVTNAGEGQSILDVEAPQAAALVPSLAATIGTLSKSARLPLLDLAMPALRLLSNTERAKLLQGVDKLIAADKKISLAEFVLQTVLARRLSPHAGRATPVRYAHLTALRTDCIVLLSLVSHVAASVNQALAPTLFAQAAARFPELGLTSNDLLEVSALDFPKIRPALDHAHQLAPLAKPMLIKMLLAATSEHTPMPVVTADLLRAFCAAIDAPIPPAVADTYTAYHW